MYYSFLLQDPFGLRQTFVWLENFQTVLIERKEDVWPSFKAFLAKDRGREQS